jgi:DNA-binding transcriptional LysR family regulator
MNRLAAMETFVRVVETGSFSAAARDLKLGQPAVSKAIAQLESRLGVQLLLRSTHRLAPTDAGQQFFERAKIAIESADAAERAARGAGTKLSGRLRIGAAVTFARLHVVPQLATFLALHPALEIEVLLDDRNIDLVSAGIDVALRLGTLADSALTARKLGQSPRLVVGTPAYFAHAGEPVTPEDLASHQAVIYEQRGGGAQWTFSQGVTKIPVTMKGRIQVNAAEGVREAVFAGLGIAVASEWMFAPELRNGTVRSVLRDWKLPPIELWAVFPSGRRASVKARAFANFIEERLSTELTLTPQPA